MTEGKPVDCDRCTRTTIRRIQDRPARSQSLYRLRYPAHTYERIRPKTKSKSAAHRHYTSIAKCTTKLPAIRRGVFAITRGNSQFIYLPNYFEFNTQLFSQFFYKPKIRARLKFELLIFTLRKSRTCYFPRRTRGNAKTAVYFTGREIICLKNSRLAQKFLIDKDWCRIKEYVQNVKFASVKRSNADEMQDDIIWNNIESSDEDASTLEHDSTPEKYRRSILIN